MTSEELEVLGYHAVAIHVAAQTLAHLSQRGNADEWLKLIMQMSWHRYRDQTPNELMECLDRSTELVIQSASGQLKPSPELSLLIINLWASSPPDESD